MSRRISPRTTKGSFVQLRLTQPTTLIWLVWSDPQRHLASYEAHVTVRKIWPWFRSAIVINAPQDVERPCLILAYCERKSGFKVSSLNIANTKERTLPPGRRQFGKFDPGISDVEPCVVSKVRPKVSWVDVEF